MKKLLEKREEARNLRKEGRSVKEVATLLNLSQSTTSLWIRDVVLTDEQKRKLWERNPISMHNQSSRKKASKSTVETWRNKRMEYQNLGRLKVIQGDSDFIAGCMLYWGEGSKTRNSVVLVNMDVSLIRVFVRFLRKSFGIVDDEIRMTIRCYSKGGRTVNEVEEYWLKELGLPRTCLCRTEVDYDKRPSSGQKIKSPFGICRIQVHKTEIVQQIFGAIQEYGHFVSDDWVK